MSKYHVVAALSAANELGIVVAINNDRDAKNNTLRLPKDTQTLDLNKVKHVVFGAGITDFEEARRAILDVVRSTVVEETPEEVTAASLQSLPNVLTEAQESAIKMGWNEPAIFRTVYLREGNTNVFTRFGNQITGRIHGSARADKAIVAVYRKDSNIDATGLSLLTNVVVMNATPGTDDLIRDELVIALSRNNHLVISSVTEVANAGRLDVALHPIAVPA